MKSSKWRIVAPVALFMSIAMTTVTHSAPAAPLNEVMTEIGQTVEPLFPLLFDEKKFERPKNRELVHKSVIKLRALFNEAKPHFETKSPTYKISYGVIDEQLGNALVAMKYDNNSYTRNILKEFVSICTSCHTQDSKLRTLFNGVSRRHFTTDLQFAEFNYMTRNYNVAIDYYNRHLKSAKKIPEVDILTIMKRILTINTQIRNRPEDAYTELAKLKDFPNHTNYTAKNLQAWLAGLTELKKQQASKVTHVTMDQLKVYVEKILGPLHDPGAAEFPTKKEKVSRVWLRGLLYHYLNNHPPKEEVPVILYWLAIIDRSINYSFYYSLADMYLKECMLQYTSHPYAKKCYEEYESYITFAYSGSRGTDIPEDVQQELKALKVRVYSAPKR